MNRYDRGGEEAIDGRLWSGVHPSPIERGSGIVVLQCGEGRRRGLNIHTPGLRGLGCGGD